MFGPFSILQLLIQGDTLEDLMSEITRTSQQMACAARKFIRQVQCEGILGRKAAPRFPITYSAELAQIYGSVMQLPQQSAGASPLKAFAIFGLRSFLLRSHNRNKRPSASRAVSILRPDLFQPAHPAPRPVMSCSCSHCIKPLSLCFESLGSTVARS